MFELVVSMKASQGLVVPDSGPGSQVVAYGTLTEGMFELVPFNKMPFQDELADQLGLTAGTPENNTSRWIKYIQDGVVCFTPLLQQRISLAWADIYKVGAVYGSDDNGVYPLSPAVTQKARVSMIDPTTGKRWYYRVRMIRTAAADPYATGDVAAATTEYMRIFGHLQSSQSSGTALWLSLSTPEIGYAGAQQQICRETPSGQTTQNLLLTGFSSYTTSSGKTTSSGNANWRPVLELIPASQITNMFPIRLAWERSNYDGLVQPAVANKAINYNDFNRIESAYFSTPDVRPVNSFAGVPVTNPNLTYRDSYARVNNAPQPMGGFSFATT